MLQQPPACLMSTDMASIQVLLHFILCNTKFHGGAIMALIEVLVNVFGRAQIEGELRIDVTFEAQYQLSYIWDNPSVVQQMASDIILPSIIPATIFGIAILTEGGLLRKVLWIVLIGLAMDHARSFWIQWTC